MKEYSNNGSTNPPTRADAQGGGFVPQFGVFQHGGNPTHRGPHYLASQPLVKVFGLVEVVQEVPASTLFTQDISLYIFNLLKF
jgi:hypothetical protein